MDDEPIIHPLDGFFMRSFEDLNTCRHDGGPIPWRDIMVYGKEVGLTASTLKGFIRIIRGMDNTFLKWHADKDKARAGRVKKPKAPVANRARKR